MSGEYGEIAYFDTAANRPFREALLDKLIAPAYAKALDLNLEAEGKFVLVDDEVQHADCRAVYDFYASPGKETVTVQAGVFVALEDLTDEALDLLQSMIASSDLSNDLKQKYMPKDILSLPGAVEQFVHQSFDINLETGAVTLRTDMGFAVGGNTIDEEGWDERQLVDLDKQRESIFESRELVELVRALYIMDLVTQEDVRDFLNAF